MNQLECRERKGNWNGHRHHHAGKHSERMRIDSMDEKEKGYFKVAHRALDPLLTKLGQVNRGDPQAPSIDEIDTMFERPIDRIPKDQEIVLFFPKEGI